MQDAEGFWVTMGMRLYLCKTSGREPLEDLASRIRQEVIDITEREIAGRVDAFYKNTGCQGSYRVRLDILIEGVSLRPLMQIPITVARVGDAWDLGSIQEGPIEAAALLESMLNHSDVDLVGLLERLHVKTYKLTRLADDLAIVLIYLASD